jgi:transcriptional regulator with XRE-family HTH domain
MEKKLIKNLASTIKLLRTTKQLSQEELADKAGLDRTYISGVERGVRNITLNSLELIINALEVDVFIFLSVLSEKVLIDLNEFKE